MNRWRIPLLVLALLLAAFLRLWRLDEMPPGLYHDEAYNGLDALSLLDGKTFPQFYEGWELYAQDAHADNPPQETRFPLFFEGNYGREPVHIYLMALSIKLFGPTPFAIRLVPALAGILAVLTTYLAASQLFTIHNSQSTIHNSKKSAAVSSSRELTIHNSQSTIHNSIPLIAAFALAVIFPAVHFSRFGLRVMLFLPVETLAVALFWRGVNGRPARFGKPRRSDFVWFAAAGIVLGLGLYVYAAGRLFPLLFVAFVPVWFWLDREAARRFWRPVGVMAAAAAATAVPLLLYFARYPYFFFFRIAYVANKGKGTVAGKPWLTWLLNVGRVIGGLFWRGETHLRHNLPGRPFLDPIQAVFFIIGLGRAAKERLNPRIIFLALWLLVMLLPSILSGDAPHFGRMTGAAPVIAIFIALGVAAIAVRITHHASRFTFYAFLLLATTTLTATAYFIRYADHPQLAADFYLPDWELGQMAAAQPAESQLYLTPTQEEMATIYFALADPERMSSYSGAGGAIPAGIPGFPALYFVRPDDAVSLQNLQAWFPDGRTGAEQNGFIPFAISEQAERVPHLSPRVPQFGDKIRLLYWAVDEQAERLRVTLAWGAAAPMTVDYTAFVHLLGAAGGPPLAQTDRPPGGYPTGDWRRGEIVADTFTIDLPPDLPPGTYTLQTGFYELATLERLGDAVELTAVTYP